MIFILLLFHLFAHLPHFYCGTEIQLMRNDKQAAVRNTLESNTCQTSCKKRRRLQHMEAIESNNMVEDLKEGRCWKRYETTLERYSGQRTLNVDELEAADCTKID